MLDQGLHRLGGGPEPLLDLLQGEAAGGLPLHVGFHLLGIDKHRQATGSAGPPSDPIQLPVENKTDDLHGGAARALRRNRDCL